MERIHEFFACFAPHGIYICGGEIAVILHIHAAAIEHKGRIAQFRKPVDIALLGLRLLRLLHLRASDGDGISFALRGQLRFTSCRKLQLKGYGSFSVFVFNAVFGKADELAAGLAARLAVGTHGIAVEM